MLSSYGCIVLGLHSHFCYVRQPARNHLFPHRAAHSYQLIKHIFHVADKGNLILGPFLGLANAIVV